MVIVDALDSDSSSTHLQPFILPYLRAVVVFGFISFFASVVLLLVITFKLISWQIRSKKSNQFVILIFNLLLADAQQALAFLLNIEWLRLKTIEVSSPICYAQGWLLSTGDLASGIWCFAIALHTFASVILDYRLRARSFLLAIFLLWSFIYGVSALAVIMHPGDIYVRSGAWCWVNHEYKDIRLWTHYVWIFIFEFGNVFIYAIIYTILIRRLKSNFYSPDQAQRVKSISTLMVVYPLVYVICTIPLASARMAAMAGKQPSLTQLCIAGAVITSNGWLDVLLYTCTRRIMIFSDVPPADDNGIDTFSTYWSKPQPSRFGGECTVEALQSNSRTWRGRSRVTLPTSSDSLPDLCGQSTKDIKLTTTTQVTSELAMPEDLTALATEMQRAKPRSPGRRWSQDTYLSLNQSTKDLIKLPP